MSVGFITGVWQCEGLTFSLEGGGGTGAGRPWAGAMGSWGGGCRARAPAHPPMAELGGCRFPVPGLPLL